MTVLISATLIFVLRISSSYHNIDSFFQNLLKISFNKIKVMSPYLSRYVELVFTIDFSELVTCKEFQSLFPTGLSGFSKGCQELSPSIKNSGIGRNF